MGGLDGVGVAVTRPEDGGGPLTRLLEAEGAEVVRWPCVTFAAPEDSGPLTAALASLDSYDWIVVTSPRAAEILVHRIDRVPDGPRTAAAGPATAARLERAGWSVDRMPDRHGGGPLVDLFAMNDDARGTRILFPCSDRSLTSTSEGLSGLGATVDRVVAYRTLPGGPDAAEVLADIDAGVRVVTFASPSAVEGLCGALSSAGAADVLARLRLSVIGATTAQALRAAGYRPTTVAEPSTLPGLVAAAVAAAGSAAGATS